MSKYPFCELLKMFPSLMDDTENGLKLHIQSTDDGCEIQADIPGIRKDEVSVSAKGSTVTISVLCRKEGRHTVYSGSKSVAVRYPFDPTSIKARTVDGVLYVTIPRSDTGAEAVKVKVG